jgi:hypothetical protein
MICTANRSRGESLGEKREMKERAATLTLTIPPLSA